jgi:hypothetical protein
MDRWQVAEAGVPRCNLLKEAQRRAQRGVEACSKRRGGVLKEAWRRAQRGAEACSKRRGGVLKEAQRRAQRGVEACVPQEPDERTFNVRIGEARLSEHPHPIRVWTCGRASAGTREGR